ncbi:MAG: coproporphyrinogen dehydrogenase HemZ [Syntrophomonadaceae bacterium]|jgi:oxygen-independent coproporphyrinogen-3 oxidase|nr:coproporphyrinogen dehydrogenase HemZ [Syntrophomonadaceae bacterium]
MKNTADTRKMMIITLRLEPPGLYGYVHELIRLAFPTAELIQGSSGEGDVHIFLLQNESDFEIVTNGSIMREGVFFDHQEVTPSHTDIQEHKKNLKRAAAICVYRLLQSCSADEINPYGILTGMRPLKLVHKIWDRYENLTLAAQMLKQDYLIREDKVGLLLEIAGHSRHLLLQTSANFKKIGIYIGVPYCPSRCYYCSFPGAVLSDYDKEIIPFLNALEYEIEVLGSAFQAGGFSVSAVYVGGGTPTVLKLEHIQKLFNSLHKHMVLEPEAEITVEAGRPDTLSLEKLQILKDYGVTRICVNPQTSDDATLHRIGRRHSWRQIVETWQMIRAVGIDHINMDMILGLPGETFQQNQKTIQDLLRLKPDNITVHSLAVKKGSDLALTEGKSEVNKQKHEIIQTQSYINDLLASHGYQPYYLYRQKYAKGHSENIGYGLPGSFCLYNIMVIEERQTILGLGGGAASKFINPASQRLTSVYNPKNPADYLANHLELTNRKVDNLKALF